MKKAFANHGMLGLAAVAVVCVAVILATVRPVAAQQMAGFRMGVMSGPMELPSEPGQRFQVNLALFANTIGNWQVHTAMDINARVLGPAGPETIRKIVTIPHELDPTGKMARVSLVQNGDNLDLYLDDTLVQSQLLDGLPPGEPVIGWLLNTHTGASGPGLTFLTGTVEVFAPDGHTIVALKEHQLSGNVTLIK